MSPGEIRDLLGVNAQSEARAKKQDAILMETRDALAKGTDSVLAGITPADALLDPGKASAYAHHIEGRAKLHLLD